jgi:hypothetical protein
MWVTVFQSLIFLAFIVVLGKRIARSFIPNESQGIATVIGSLTVVALLSIAGTAVYYLTSVTALSLFVAGAFVAIGIVLGTRYQISAPSDSPMNGGGNASSVVYIAIIAIALGAWWTVILANPITDATRSVWLVVPPVTIIAPALAMVMSFLLLRISKRLGTIALFATLFSIFASAAVLFPLGAGFDPFLHRATVLHITEHGTITPKPLYYIGEYALELFARLLGGIPIFTVDTFLAPTLAAIILTVAARKLPIGAAILLLALSNFVTTTPQSIGYLFAILVVITIPNLRLSTPYTPHPTPFIIPFIFSLAAFAAHPIAGVPALALVVYSVFQNRLLRTIVAIGSAIALPAMFVLQATLSHSAITLTLQNLWRLDLLPLSGFFTSNGNTWLDALYFIIGNLSLITLILAVIGTGTNRSNLTEQERNSGIIALTLMISFVIVALGVNFGYLIDYERQDFALRFLTLASLFALPLASRGLFQLRSLLPRYTLYPIPYTLFILCCATIYALYPRHDGYVRSAAFNVSQADIDTVYAIHVKETDDADYIVLSNQATAAAALQEFGFRKYYHTNIFYYPIPTGGTLYQSYLSMVNDIPTKEIVTTAMQTAGVHKAYFVVSDYWWKSDQIIENAKPLTEEWFAVDGGKTVVFVFTDEE